MGGTVDDVGERRHRIGVALAVGERHVIARLLGGRRGLQRRARGGGDRGGRGGVPILVLQIVFLRHAGPLLISWLFLSPRPNSKARRRRRRHELDQRVCDGAGMRGNRDNLTDWMWPLSPLAGEGGDYRAQARYEPGEGAFRCARNSGEAPSPDAPSLKLRRVDLSPHAGRGEEKYYSPQARKASSKARAPGVPFSIARMARLPLV